MLGWVIVSGSTGSAAVLETAPVVLCAIVFGLPVLTHARTHVSASASADYCSQPRGTELGHQFPEMCLEMWTYNRTCPSVHFSISNGAPGTLPADPLLIPWYLAIRHSVVCKPTGGHKGFVKFAKISLISDIFQVYTKLRAVIDTHIYVYIVPYSSFNLILCLQKLPRVA